MGGKRRGAGPLDPLLITATIWRENLMCCKKVAIFYDNKYIDATIIMQKICWSVSLYQKFILLKAGSWLQSCKMTGHEQCGGLHYKQ